MKKIFAVTIMLVMMCSGMVYADGCKIYPGVMGVRANASQPVPWEYWGALGNPSSKSSLAMALPVVRDCNHGKLANGWVRLVDQHYNSDISVKLISTYRDGATGVIYAWQSPVQTTVGSGPQVQTKVFTALGANHYSSAYYWVVLPPSYNGKYSHVISYHVNED